MDNFRSLLLPERLLQSLDIMGFTTPTPIQAQIIPSALQGKDILGSANTGTGKTAAYGIPLAAHVLNNPTANSALVLTPTRELAIQVLGVLNSLLGKRSGVETVLLIGGDSMSKQLMRLKQLKGRPHVIVGTPGRVNDHLSRKTLHLDAVNFFVLDETDRMLDMGFTAQLQTIVQYLPEQHQTLMFSATMDSTIIRMAEGYLKDAVRVSVGSTISPAEKIKQETVHVSESEKHDALLNILIASTGPVIVFVKTRFKAERLADQLSEEGHNADAIHGDLRQGKRERVINAFRNGRSRILVATDVAARGLDIPAIECVVNFDLPQCPEDYIHRIGRTGRAGAEGKAVSFVCSQDNMKWRSIRRLMNPSEKEEPIRNNSNRDGSRRFGGNGGYNGRGRSGDRPAWSNDRPRSGAFGGDRSRSNSDRPRGGGFGGDRSRSNDDRPRFSNDRPRSNDFSKPAGERSSVSGEDSRFGGDRPRKSGGFGGDRSRSNSERPRTGGFGGERSRSNDFSKPAGERSRSNGGEGSRFGGDRPRTGGFGGERSRSNDDRPRFNNDRPRSNGGNKSRSRDEEFRPSNNRRNKW